jgi:hypothetical protein
MVGGIPGKKWTGRTEMISSDEAGLVETQQLEDLLAEALPSSEEVVSAIRVAREDVELVASLLSDEKVIVESLIEVLPRLSPLLSRAAVDPSVLPVEMGEVEEARLVSDGRLIVCHIDGEIMMASLTVGTSRDLLVDVMRDIVPKLREILESVPVFEEPDEEPEPIIPETPEVEEHTIQEPTEEFLAPEELPEEEELVQEPLLEEAGEPLGAEEPGIIAEPTVAEPVTPIEPAHKREPEVSLPVATEELPETPPVKLGEAPLRAHRRRVRRNSEAVRRQMAEVRRMRDSEIRMLREGIETQWDLDLDKPKGFFERLKRLFSRKRQ